jgi:MFS family permease
VLGLLTVAALAATAYAVYDLKCPSHFVGDMYGIEVLWRLSFLGMAVGGLLSGWLLVAIGRRRKTTAWSLSGTVIVIVASLVLAFIGLDIARSRHKDAIRKEYPQKTAHELLSIAREDKDQYALYAIMMKKDSAAVAALSEILLDEKEPTRLRYVAAHGLGAIGGETARAALTKARGLSGDASLQQMIDHALEMTKEHEEAEKHSK